MIRHLSLRDWLRWIQASRSDAVLRVRTPDGGSGIIWCNAGKVVDASWGTLTPVAALREMLQLGSGAVTIDFEPSERPRRVARPALDLVPIVEGPGRFGDLIEAEATPAAAPGAAVADPFARHSLASPVSNAPQVPRPSLLRPQAGRISRGEYLAAGLLLPALVLGAFAFGRLRAANDSDSALTLEPQQAQQTKAGLLPPPPARRAEPAAPNSASVPLELPVIPFVALEVEPANAEVWLDHALIGLGRVELAPIPDGALHELHFVAEGHAARSLFFVDSPPAGRVILEPMPGSVPTNHAIDGAKPVALADEASEGASPGEDSAEDRGPVKRLTRRHTGATAPQATAREPAAPSRQRPPADPAAAAAKSTDAKKSPQVQLIEARTPHVQVVE